MRSARIQQRAVRLEEQCAMWETERCLQCLAAEMELDPETLRGEAIALVARFAAAGVVTTEAKLALVAEEVAMPIEELRREVDEAVAHC
jgi:hypothetical protein